MSACLYYVPNETRSISTQRVAELGLGHAFDRDRWIAREAQHGPGGTAGVCLMRKGSMDGSKLGYYPDRQSWRVVPHSSAFVGYYTEDRPTPATLVRAQILPGHLVELADGNRYEIPVARQWVELDGAPKWACMLPERTEVDANGAWTPGGVIARHAALWAVAEKWWETIRGAEVTDEGGETIKVAFNFAELNDSALLALATNYHVSRAEVGALGLFDDRCAREVLNALVDWPTLAEWLKKKRAPESDG